MGVSAGVRGWVAGLVGLGLCWSLAGAAQNRLAVSLFSPQGTVKEVRQAAVRFATPMVTFGDPRTEAPFVIDCPAAGRARWADPRNWVYDFEQDLPAGVRCSFTLAPDAKDLAGRPLAGQSTFTFDTGGPAIIGSLPEEGSETVDEGQVFLVSLNGEVDPATIPAHAWCEVDGLNERIGVELLEGEARRQVLDQRRRLGYQYFRVLWKRLGLVTEHRVQDEQLLKQAEDRLLALRCSRPLPPQTGVSLVWGEGIAAPSGIATTEVQRRAFRTRPEFTVRMQCERANANRPCLPMRPIDVVFSAPVPAALAADVRLFDAAGGKGYAATLSGASVPLVERLSFAGPFPEHAKLRIELPAGLKDDAGRLPANASRFPLEVAVDEYPPLAKFSGDLGIIEWGEGGVLPVTLRNLEDPVAAARIPGTQRRVDSDAEITQWIQAVHDGMARNGEWTEDGKDAEGRDIHRWTELTGSAPVLAQNADLEHFELPKPAGGEAFEVVGIPMPRPGFYVVELASPRLGAALLGDDRPRYVATAALVTDLGIHFKWGREESLVWVTRLSDGAPVADARIAISSFKGHESYWQGSTDAQGLARVPAGKLPARADLCCDHLFVSARAGEDLSFVDSDWSQGINPDDFQLPTVWNADPTIAHTVLDRALLRAGETVSMKHYLRRHTQAGLSVPEPAPTKLRIVHAGSAQVFEQPVSFDSGGVAESRWEIPKEAKLGLYRIELQSAGGGTWSSGEFRVEQFRLPTMSALVQGPKDDQIAPAQVPLDLYVGYLSGGGAGGMPVKLRTLLQPRAVSFKAYPDYRFGGEAVSAGPADEEEPEDWLSFARFVGRQRGEEQPRPARELPLTLDGAGAARVSVPVDGPLTRTQDLLAELEYQDANGERLTVAGRIPLWTAGVHLGIRTDRDGTALRFRVLALDLKGRPLVGRAVRAELFQRVTYSYRKRLVGGFYSYEHQTENRALPVSCEGQTDAQGLLFCDVQAGVAGEVLIQATAKDEAGRTARAVDSTWIYQEDEDVWFAAGDTDRMDLIPERTEYRGGETARFQVRMPFRRASALVTVEREGVIDAFVTELSGRNPVVEVPIGQTYSPNVYVSVLALRGRIGGFQSWAADMLRRFGLPWQLEGGRPTALVDLSKPAYRMGMAHIRVDWAPHRLAVQVTPERDSYRVREHAKVKVKVARADGGPLPAGTEIAFAAVDEALLELKANDSWRLLEAMMDERPIEVYSSTAQMQVVGKRHYGRKAVPQGGGGGRKTARELFDTLLLWKGRVAVDAMGEAELDVPLNDALTRFRLVAVASAGTGLFGTGQASIRSTQDLMLHSGLAPLVRESDRIESVFTLRNASQRAMKVEVDARVSRADGTALLPLETKLLSLEPGGASELRWELTTPVDAGELRWDVSAAEQGGEASDELKVSQQVVPVYPVRIYQATLTQVDPSYQLAVQRPADAVPGRGGIRVGLRARLGDGLDGVVEYMRRYPWICLEQQVSSGVVLDQRSVLDRLEGYLDRNGLLKYFASLPQGSDTLTSYVLSVLHEAGWTIPDQVQGRMLGALEQFVDGRIVLDSPLPTADLAIRKLAAIAALTAYGRGNLSMLDSIDLQPDLWPTSALLDWVYLLKHLPGIEGQPARLEHALQVLRARINFQGSTMGFSTERSDALWWLMISADGNATRAVLGLLDEPQWREDLPRLVTGALGRMRNGHWSTTPANAWGVLAMRRFSEQFERVPVSGATEVGLGGQVERADWAERAKTFDLAWPQPEGLPGTLAIHHQGQGRPWAMVQSRAALPLKAPLFTGYTIKREVEAIEQREPGRWSKGDVARVTLDLEAQSDMTWVVVEDPIPAGATILGSGLGRDSSLLTRGEDEEGYAWPAYQERRFDSYRAYYQFVPKGTWKLQYTLRLNSAGAFQQPPTRVEAMYAPEMFGELPNAPVVVEGAP